MIGQDVVNAALEGMNLLVETFSRKGRKMPRLSIKVSDKNLIKVASLNGERQHWCSYWIVPAIPNSGIFPVPAGFRFSINLANYLFVENEAGDHKIQLFEGDYLILVAPSIRELIAETSEGETRIWLSKGIFVANAKYFKQHWEPAEKNEKTIRELIARGTLIDSESDSVISVRDEKLSPHWNSKEEVTERVWTHFAVDFAKPDLEMIHRMEECLRGQGRAVIDTLNPSKDQLEDSARLLRTKGYSVFYGGDGNLDSLVLLELQDVLKRNGYVSYSLGDEDYWSTVKYSLRQQGYRIFQSNEYDNKMIAVEDRAYESGYVKGMREMRRINEVSKNLATEAYQTGFEAGRMVEKLGILKGEKSHDREERESASEGDSRVGGTFPFTGEVTSRFSSRHAEKIARHGANFRYGTEGFRESEPRSHSATQWADSEQPQYSEPGEPTGDSIHQADGETAPQRDENEKGDA